MSAVFSSLDPHGGVPAARLVLAQLAQCLAETGFAATRACPGLLAAVDQHAAAVRDTLAEEAGGGAAPIGAVALAAYAAGVCDTAARHGWQLPTGTGTGDWSAPAWPLLRLLAVCALAGPA